MGNYNRETERLLGEIEKKRGEGRKLTMSDKLLVRMSDGEWHEAAELAYNVSWRFGGYLHNLKKQGVEWEKERIPNTESCVYKYRLCKVDEPNAEG